MKSFIKRYLFIALFICIWAICYIGLEDAYAHTPNSIVKQIKADGYYKSVADKYSKIAINSDKDTISFKFAYSPKGDDKHVTLTTNFVYDKGIITYKYNGDKKDYTHIYIDSVFIKSLIHAVGILQGIDSKALSSMDPTYKLYNYKEHGLEIYSYTYSTGDKKTGITKETAFDSMKLNVNSFTLGDTTKLTVDEPKFVIEENKSKDDIDGSDRDTTRSTKKPTSDVSSKDKKNVNNEALFFLLFSLIILTIIVIVIILITRSKGGDSGVTNLEYYTDDEQDDIAKETPVKDTSIELDIEEEEDNGN